MAELVVSSSLTLVVLIMGYQVLSATNHTAAAVGNRAQNSTNARLAIDNLEANLRYADAVWVCGPAVNLIPCSTAPTATVPPTAAALNTLTVENAAGSNNFSQPFCAHWTLTSAGLVETVNGTANTVTPGAVAYAGSSGFSLPLPTLVQIDLSVNGETVGVTAGDAVTVHDVVAPDNLASTQAPTPSTTPCTP